MPNWLRDLSDFLGDRATLFGMAAAIAVVLTITITILRRLNQTRLERAYFYRRVVVAPRSDIRQRAGLTHSTIERRRWPRRMGHPIQVDLFDEADSVKFGEGRLDDRSAGGVGIATAAQLPVGERIVIHLRDHADGVPSIPCEVRNSRVVPAGWRLGCAFCRDPSASDMMNLR